MNVENTIELVSRSRDGDAAAQNTLVARYLPLLARWAHGRLPASARDLSETSDLVQVALLRAFQNLASFDVQGPGAFFGYLRQIMSNLLRDELRRVGRRPAMAELDDNLAEPNVSPVENTITLETIGAYERALQNMAPDQRDLITMRVEMGLDLSEIAVLTQSPSPNAARMRVARALADLALQMSAYRVNPAS